MRKFTYTLPEIPPSNNRFIGRRNNWEYQSEKKRWARMISLLCVPKPKKPFEKAKVRLTYRFKNRIRRDPDNYSGKFILDGLVHAGIITDDSFGNIELILCGGYDKDNPRTEIEVTGA
ncbi:MAG: RusA family crossover junction endodeoxyribonuclease [Clostridium sp.]|nr:RusA family crossover junction endodeoxyribonuclease [Clostridium sp.]MCM1547933.1 RusA family crossover junction endodeoxyribonuclease [Ruminococcus sp.]